MENAGPFIGQRIGGQAIVLAGIVFMSIDCFVCDIVQHVSDTFIHSVSVHYWCRCVLIYNIVLSS